MKHLYFPRYLLLLLCLTLPLRTNFWYHFVKSPVQLWCLPLMYLVLFNWNGGTEYFELFLLFLADYWTFLVSFCKKPWQVKFIHTETYSQETCETTVISFPLVSMNSMHGGTRSWRERGACVSWDAGILGGESPGLPKLLLCCPLPLILQQAQNGTVVPRTRHLTPWTQKTHRHIACSSHTTCDYG